MAIVGSDSSLLIQVALLVRYANRHSACKRHIALLIEQALASKTDGYQRGRTGRLNADARSFEVQFVRNPGRQIVLLVSNHELERTDRFHDLGILKQVRKEVAIISVTGKDAD